MGFFDTWPSRQTSKKREYEYRPSQRVLQIIREIHGSEAVSKGKRRKLPKLTPADYPVTLAFQDLQDAWYLAEHEPGEVDPLRLKKYERGIG